jgi:hypothetical protein
MGRFGPANMITELSGRSAGAVFYHPRFWAIFVPRSHQGQVFDPP